MRKKIPIRKAAPFAGYGGARSLHAAGYMKLLSASGLAALLVLAAAPVRADSVRVAIVQMESKDGDVTGNLSKVDAHVATAKAAGAHIVVLPELVDAGFGAIVRAKTGGAAAAHPIPGSTSDTLGAIAKKHGVWISAAILESVPGGAYDSNVVIDSSGRVVLRQRKAFVYPLFGGGAAFEGDFHDMETVELPWGRIGVLNCVDTGSPRIRPSSCSHSPTPPPTCRPTRRPSPRRPAHPRWAYELRKCHSFPTAFLPQLTGG